MFLMHYFCIWALLRAPVLRPSNIGVNPGGFGGSRPQILDREVVGVAGVTRGVVGDSGRVVKYYYILSCTGSMFESGNF